MLDWQTGLEGVVTRAGLKYDRNVDTDRVIDAQAAEERNLDFVDYATVTRDSLVKVFGMPEAAAAEAGAKAGEWPLFADSAEGLASLMAFAPCVAMTNSDIAHGRQVQKSLGFALSGWVCAEQTRVYKPRIEFWTHVARKYDIEPGRQWWHVSAYADYDLSVARELGLTCVFIPRPHSRVGSADLVACDLVALANLVLNGIS